MKGKELRCGKCKDTYDGLLEDWPKLILIFDSPLNSRIFSEGQPNFRVLRSAKTLSLQNHLCNSFLKPKNQDAESKKIAIWVVFSNLMFSY